MWFGPFKSLSRHSFQPYIMYCYETAMQVHCSGMFVLASRCSVLWRSLLTKAVVTLGGPLHTLRCLSSNQDYYAATIPLGFVYWLLEKVQHKADHVQTQGCVDQGQHTSQIGPVSDWWLLQRPVEQEIVAAGFWMCNWVWKSEWARCEVWVWIVHRGLLRLIEPVALVPTFWLLSCGSRCKDQWMVKDFAWGLRDNRSWSLVLREADWWISQSRGTPESQVSGYDRQRQILEWFDQRCNRFWRPHSSYPRVFCWHCWHRNSMVQESSGSRNIWVEVEKQNQDLDKWNSWVIRRCHSGCLKVFRLCHFHLNFAHVRSAATTPQMLLPWDHLTAAYFGAGEWLQYHSKDVIVSLLLLEPVQANPWEWSGVFAGSLHPSAAWSHQKVDRCLWDHGAYDPKPR